VKTPEPESRPATPPVNGHSWRDIVQSGADFAQIDGFVLEHLIDLQRDRARQPGEGR
jgi:hypothetical protein